MQGRNAKDIVQLTQTREFTRAGLRVEEVIALRMYTGALAGVVLMVLACRRVRRACCHLVCRHLETVLTSFVRIGPMYTKYNSILRDMAAMEDADKSTNLYPTTLGLIVSGILKLCRVATMPQGAVAFRGLSGLELPASFFELDEQGFAGGVEPALMSSSLSEDVARKYSVVSQGRDQTIFRLLLGKMSLGADVSWLSQFADEQEMLFPPRTHLQIVGKPARGVDGVLVVTLKPTLFQNVRTIEEVEESRREDMKQMSASLVWELRNKAAREQQLDAMLDTRLNALEKKLVADNCSQEARWYNDNGKYKEAFLNLFCDAEKARAAVFDSSSYVSRTLDAQAGSHSADAAPLSQNAGAAGAGAALHAPSSRSKVGALHFKFWQDPNFKGIRGKFGTDMLFAAGIVALVGPMDVQVGTPRL